MTAEEIQARIEALPPDLRAALLPAFVANREIGFAPNAPPETVVSLRLEHYKSLCIPKLPPLAVARLRELYPRGLRGPCKGEASSGLKEFLAKWRGSSVLVSGNYGVGKTVVIVAAGILAILGQAGIGMPTSAVWYSAATLDSEPPPPIIRDAGILLIDDLHRVAEARPWRRNSLFAVVDHRYQNNRPTVAASRRARPWLDEKLGGEWADRLVGDGGMLIHMLGGSRR